MINDLEKLYNQINTHGREAISQGREQIDPVLNNLAHDKRLGLALLIPVRDQVAKNLKLRFEAIRRIEPQQYFYPSSDLHITVLDLISGRDDFNPNDPLITASRELIRNAVCGFPSFEIEFRGLIASDAAILAAGYYQEGLQTIRSCVRENARLQNIDLKERYQSISAHSTIVRFKSQLHNRAKLLALLRKYQDFPIGRLEVTELELVIHDWYNGRREIIERFGLFRYR